MSEIEYYRIAVNGKGTSRGPYDSIAATRNVASNVYPGGGPGEWAGVNRKVTNESIAYDWQTREHTYGDVVRTIQKLTAVLKPNANGSFTMELEWVDLA